MKQINFTQKFLTVCLVLAFAAGLTFNANAVGWASKAPTVMANNNGDPFSGGVAWSGKFGASLLVGYVLPGSDNLGNYDTELMGYDPNANSRFDAATFTNRRDAVSWAVGDSAYVATGGTGSGSNSLYIFKAGSVISRAPVPGVARRNAVAFTIGGKGYVGLGRDNGGAPLGDFYQYDPGTNTWATIAVFPGSARYGAVAFAIGNKGYVGTGNDGTSSLADWYEYNATTNSWSTKTPLTFSARYFGVGFTVGNKGYVGTGTDGSTRFADVYEYNSSTDGWSSVGPIPGPGVEQAVGVAIGGKGYIGSGTTTGSNGGNVDGWYEYTPANSFLTMPVSGTAYVPGSQINVYYATTGTTTYGSGNVFTAYLSNVSGSFASEVAIGTVTSQGGNGYIPGIIPTSTVPGGGSGGGYRVRVKSSSPAATTTGSPGADNGSDIEIASPAHLHFSILNATQTTPKVIEFEVWVKSDGVSSVNLKANSFQFGINYNTAILQSGATVTPTYFASSNDANFSGLTNFWSFPASTFAGHVRFVESAYTGNSSSTPQLSNGTYYKIGKYRLTSSANWVSTPSATLTLETANVAGRTNTAGLVYLGTDGASTTSIADPGSGNLQLLTTDASLALNTCTGFSATGNVSGVTCNAGSNGTASVNVSGGFTPYTYLWFNNSTNATVSGLGQGTYNVTVTDAISCTATATATITQPTAVTISGTTKSNYNGSDLSCYNSTDGTITVAASGGTGALQYSDDNGGTYQPTNLFSGLGAGTYIIKVKDANNCPGTSTQSVTLVAPSAVSPSAGNNSPVCVGSPLTLNSSATGGTGTYTFAWSGPPANTYSSGSQNPTVTASATTANAGTYTVTVTDQNGCPATTSTVATVNICTSTVNLKLNIQGYYQTVGPNAHSMAPAIYNEFLQSSPYTSSDVDSIDVQLRSTSGPAYSLVEDQKVIVHTDGTASATFSAATLNNSYYVAVFHRQAIQTWSKNPVTMLTTFSYDFTTAANKAYGDNQILLENYLGNDIYGIYNGDLNQDLNVDLLDFPILDYDIKNGCPSPACPYLYRAADFDGNGNVNITDFSSGFELNIRGGRYSKNPLD